MLSNWFHAENKSKTKRFKTLHIFYSMNSTKKRNFNNLSLGFGTSILLPAVAVYVFYLTRHSNISFWEFISATAFIQMSSALLSVAAVPNLAAFFIFLQTYRYKSSRGVILGTLLLAVLGFILKFTVG